MLTNDGVDPAGRVECDLRQVEPLFGLYDRLVDLQTQSEVGSRGIVILQHVGNLAVGMIQHLVHQIRGLGQILRLVDSPLFVLRNGLFEHLRELFIESRIGVHVLGDVLGRPRGNRVGLGRFSGDLLHLFGETLLVEDVYQVGDDLHLTALDMRVDQLLNLPFVLLVVHRVGVALLHGVAQLEEEGQIVLVPLDELLGRTLMEGYRRERHLQRPGKGPQLLVEEHAPVLLAQDIAEGLEVGRVAYLLEEVPQLGMLLGQLGHHLRDVRIGSFQILLVEIGVELQR